jgi:two-component system invasion response regulator UvrY
MVRVLIVDDHAIVREGLKQILAETPDLVVAGEARDGLEALKKVREHRYEVIVLDISMPGRSGLDILKDLKARDPDLRVIVLSVHPEEQYAVRVLRAGAAGYLTKVRAPDELVAAIREVSAGRRYIPPSVGEQLARELELSGKPPHKCLSDREFQVMLMSASGKAVKEIARELLLSPKTVSTYRRRVLEKLGLCGNAELTRYVIEHLTWPQEAVRSNPSYSLKLDLLSPKHELCAQLERSQVQRVL